MSRGATRSIGSRPFMVISGILFAVIVGVLACSDGSQKLLGVGDASGRVGNPGGQHARGNPYKFVGEEHNAQLDHTLRELAKRRTKNMKHDDMCTLIDEITRDYLARRGKTAFDFRPHPKGDPCRGSDNSRLALGEDNLVIAQSFEYDPSFAPAAIDMVNQIEAIMLNSTSAADLAARLAQVDEAAQATLAGTDAALVLGVSSIALSSANYWAASMEHWEAVFSEGGDPGVMPYLRADAETPVFTGRPGASGYEWSGVKAVGWMDVSGGVIGGLRGVFGGPGGVLSGAAAGAAYSSIAGALGMIGKKVAEAI